MIGWGLDSLSTEKKPQLYNKQVVQGNPWLGAISVFAWWHIDDVPSSHSPSHLTWHNDCVFKVQTVSFNRRVFADGLVVLMNELQLDRVENKSQEGMVVTLQSFVRCSCKSFHSQHNLLFYTGSAKSMQPNVNVLLCHWRWWSSLFMHMHIPLSYSEFPSNPLQPDWGF